MPDEPWDRALEEALRELLSGSPDTAEDAPANDAANDAATRFRPAREAAEREVPARADAEGRASGALARRAAEEGARAAFRTARDAGLHTSMPTRRRDDWSPAAAPRCQGSALRAVVAGLLASLTLGGVALATGGLPAGFLDPPAAPRPADSATHDRASGPAGTETGRPGPSDLGTPFRPDRHPVPPPAENREALCHAVGLGREKKGQRGQGDGKAHRTSSGTDAKADGRDETLESTAWRRLATAAGGEERVAAYCHREPRSDRAAAAADPPAAANTAEKPKKASEKASKGAGGENGNGGGSGNGGAKQSSGGAS
ncbi:hypothetical protein [Streptomyces sp. NPDC048338]|uniref:hypothetical protein n=1 Tax=Streptomyces sp. NPDC048338 TaxID=3365536 RepID=UPI00371E917C